jgi:hypothetical protein
MAYWPEKELLKQAIAPKLEAQAADLLSTTPSSAFYNSRERTRYDEHLAIINSVCDGLSDMNNRYSPLVWFEDQRNVLPGIAHIMVV